MVNFFTKIRKFIVESLGMLAGDAMQGESSGPLTRLFGNLSWSFGKKLNQRIDTQVRKNDSSFISYEDYLRDKINYRNDHVERLRLTETERSISPRI